MNAGTGVLLVFIGAIGLVLLGFLAEIARVLMRRRRAAAWREIHGRVRDGLGPGEES